METLCNIAELVATLLESFMAVWVTTELSEKRYKGKKNLAIVCAFALVHAAIITLLNQFNVFSFLTMTVSVLVTFAITFVTSKGKALLRAASTMLLWFAMNAVDYLIFYISLMIAGHSIDISKGVNVLLTPGLSRSIFIIATKLIELAIFLGLKRFYSNLASIENRELSILFILSGCSFLVLNVIMANIMSDSVLTLQISVIFTVFYILISLVCALFATAVNHRYQEEKHEKEIATLNTELMERNLKNIYNSQNLIRRQVHDFKNHLRTIEGMLDENSKAKQYTDELLELSYTYAQYCDCGNEFINSIINCKYAEAAEQKIDFRHSITLDREIKISSVDICTILANQIDNAIEACEKLKDGLARKISVEIWQKETFLFFKVINTVGENPFKDGKLVSTKNDTAIHGFGIKNIQETVERYNGELKNIFSDNKFISVAVVVNK